MTRWRIDPEEERAAAAVAQQLIIPADSVPEPEFDASPRTSACVPHVVETARGEIVARFSCDPGSTRLCPCYFDALLQARTYTWESAKVCVVLRESDRHVMGRNGPAQPSGEPRRYSKAKPKPR
jgi:hypothetical protein